MILLAPLIEPPQVEGFERWAVKEITRASYTYKFDSIMKFDSGYGSAR